LHINSGFVLALASRSKDGSVEVREGPQTLEMARNSRRKRDLDLKNLFDPIEFLMSTPTEDWMKMLGSEKIGASFGAKMRNAFDLYICKYTYYCRICLVLFQHPALPRVSNNPIAPIKLVFIDPARDAVMCSSPVFHTGWRYKNACSSHAQLPAADHACHLVPCVKLTKHREFLITPLEIPGSSNSPRPGELGVFGKSPGLQVRKFYGVSAKNRDVINLFLEVWLMCDLSRHI
jgi:hypothetical protein